MALDLVRLAGKFVLKSSPLALIYFNTTRCNLACKHCFYHEELNKDKSDELTIPELEKISRSLGQLLYINITGGEPFVRKDLLETVEVFYGNCKPRKITITSNGYYMSDMLQFAENVGRFPKSLVELNISMDGLQEEHDLIRGSEGIFKKALETYQALQPVKAAAKNLRVGFITTAMKDNIKSLNRTFDFLAGFKPDFLSLNLIRGGPKEPVQKGITYEDYERSLHHIDSLGAVRKENTLLGKLRSAKSEYLTELRKTIYMENRFVIPCTAGDRIGVLYSNGDVAPCELLNDRLGNIRSYGFSFHNLWKTEHASKIRKWVVGTKCFCTHECFLTASIAFSPTQLAKVAGRLLIRPPAGGSRQEPAEVPIQPQELKQIHPAGK